MIPDHPDASAPAPPTTAEPATPAPEAAEIPSARLPGKQRLPAERRALMAAGMTAAALGLTYVVTARFPSRPAVPPPKPALKAVATVQPVADRTAPGLAPEERQALVESVVRSQKKRILGRKRSLPDVARIVTLVGPLVARALEQPSIQADLRALAGQEGMTLAEYKRYFQHKQEADLLLESGGDPNARSVSNAIGVAQFLAGTARASGGLKVNLPESRRLSWRIAALQDQIAALQTLPEGWTKPLPGSTPASLLVASAPTSGPPERRKPSGTHIPLTSRGARTGRALPPQTPPPAPSPAAPAPEPAKDTAAVGSEPSAAPAVATAGDPSEKAAANVEHPTSSPDAGAAPSGPEPAAPAVPQPAAPAPQPTAPAPQVITRDELIGKRAQELRLLEAKRRQADERYDPAKAIAAQTRYLVRMTRRYGSLDWVFQAYHGGEGGVRNTVSYYLGSRWQQFASAECAIRGVLASRGGQLQRVRQPLSFEDLYFKTTPLTQPAAFSYLYGRSDNHRYYWWKILSAERAIDLYRRDPEEFRQQWRALRPGQRLEVVWYPGSEGLSFHDVAALKQGYASGHLVHWPASARSRGLALGDVAPLDPVDAYQYKGLRPEALGALYRIAALYMANGGSKAPLRLHSLVQTEAYRTQLNAVHPPYWMRHPLKPGEEAPIDLQPTGLCFDIERPAADWNRKVLEYALGYLADRNQIYWVEEREQGPRRYHVCPSPDFRRELVRDIRPTATRKRPA